MATSENEAVDKTSVKGDVPQVARGSISLWLWHAGYMLKWTIKASHLCLHFGALFVGSMRLEYAGPKTSGHGPTVQATVKRATSLTMPTVSHTIRLWCTCVLSQAIVYTVRYYCTIYQWNVSGQRSVMASQVTVWSDKVQAVMNSLFSSLHWYSKDL